MSDILNAAKSRAQELISDLSRPGGLRSTVESIKRRMAVADERRALRRARDEVERLEAQLGETLTALGLQSLGLYEAGDLPSPELEPLCERAVTIRQSLTDQKEALDRLEALARARREAPSRRCPSCGQAIPDESAFCPHCGAAVAPRIEPHLCAACGSQLREDAKFCPKCGAPTSE